MKFAHIRVSEYFTFAEQIFHSEAISLARRANFVEKSTSATQMCFFLEAPPGIGPGIKVLQTSALPLGYGAVWSGLRGSNPPPRPWQGRALPNELNPHLWCLRSESNQRHGDFQSPALPTELSRRLVGGLIVKINPTCVGDPKGTRTPDL